MARLFASKYVGPSVAWMDNGSVGPSSVSVSTISSSALGPSVRRGSESMCGALGGLDGQSICGPSLESVWDPQRPRCNYSHSMGPLSECGALSDPDGQGICGALSPSAGPSIRCDS